MKDVSKVDNDCPEISKDLPITMGRGVLIHPCEREIEKQGIIIPDTVKTIPFSGWVVGIGEELKGMIEIGQKIIFNQKVNLWITHGNVKYWGCHENDVRCKVDVIDGVKTLTPFNKSVLLEDIATEVIYSGIILPGNQKIINYGRIKGLGHACDPRLKIGQKVIYNPWADASFMYGGKNIHHMIDDDILFILHEENYVGTQDHGKERRPDIDLDKLPDIEPKQERLKGTTTFDLKDKK